jgi:hypothetical protein
MQSKLALTKMSGTNDAEQLKMLEEEEQLVVGIPCRASALQSDVCHYRALSCSVSAE